MAIWLVATFALNMLLSLFFSNRGEVVLWLLRNALSPGVSARIALSVSGHFVSSVQSRAQVIGFTLGVLVASTLGTLYNYQFYVGAGRVEDWYHVLWGVIANAVAASIGAVVYLRKGD